MQLQGDCKDTMQSGCRPSAGGVPLLAVLLGGGGGEKQSQYTAEGSPSGVAFERHVERIERRTGGFRCSSLRDQRTVRILAPVLIIAQAEAGVPIVQHHVHARQCGNLRLTKRSVKNLGLPMGIWETITNTV
jgi:hypothetical protein